MYIWNWNTTNDLKIENNDHSMIFILTWNFSESRIVNHRKLWINLMQIISLNDMAHKQFSSRNSNILVVKIYKSMCNFKNCQMHDDIHEFNRSWISIHKSSAMINMLSYHFKARRIKPKVVKKTRTRPRPQHDQPQLDQPQLQSQIGK